MELCAHLLWQSALEKRWTSLEQLQGALEKNQVPFSCGRTCRPWGPDDGPAAPERCGGHRRCYEASPWIERLSAKLS